MTAGLVASLAGGAAVIAVIVYLVHRGDRALDRVGAEVDSRRDVEIQLGSTEDARDDLTARVGDEASRRAGAEDRLAEVRRQRDDLLKTTAAGDAKAVADRMRAELRRLREVAGHNQAPAAEGAGAADRPGVVHDAPDGTTPRS